MHDVYISYDPKNKALAQAICYHLEGEKIECWMAPRDIEEGVNFDDIVLEAISNSSTFLMILNDKEHMSERMANETNIAMINDLAVVPFRLEHLDQSLMTDIDLNRELFLILSQDHRLEG